MLSNTDLQDLIRRLTDKAKVAKTISTPFGDRQIKTNRGSVSWNAHQETRQLNDLSLVPPLEELLASTKDREQRTAIYSVLSHIGHNTQDRRIVDILIKQLPKESEPMALYILFRAIGEQPKFRSLKPIIPYITHKKSLVRNAATSALANCEDPQTENVLLEMLEHTKDDIERGYVLSSLYGVGTPHSLPRLTQMFEKVTGELKANVVGLLSKIGGSAYQSYFLGALADRSPHVKWVAMKAISIHGNDEAIDPVVQRIKVILSKSRKVGQSPKSELIEGLEFLNQYRTNNEAVRKLFEWVAIKKMDFLFKEEKDQFLAIEKG